MGMIYKPKWKDKAGAVHESEVFWIKYYRNGKPYRESSKTTKEDDAKKLLKLREGFAGSHAETKCLYSGAERCRYGQSFGQSSTFSTERS